MKKIAVVISTMPHGSARGREAVDAALALSIYNQVSLFFIGDGTFHLLNGQQPTSILMRDYIKALKLIELYEINNRFACQQDLIERHITIVNIPVVSLDRTAIAGLLTVQDGIIHF